MALSNVSYPQDVDQLTLLPAARELELEKKWPLMNIGSVHRSSPSASTRKVSAISSLTLRDARSDDCDLILELIRELAVFERLEHECIADAALLRHFLFEDKKAYAIVAEWEGLPAGFALYFYNFSTFLGRPGLYLEDLFVRPAFRRKGIARSIFHWLAKKAVTEGCGRFEWSVLDWNENAIAFYRALGARPLDEWIIQRLTGESLKRLADQA